MADIEPSGFRIMPATIARTAPVGRPRLVTYEYRARTYPWAVEVLRAAEAIHGAPQPGRPGRPRKDGTTPAPRPSPSGARR